ncbi:MAG: DUF484 family protein [Gammaproteobacteria bacterium]|jgi:hypothetical protein|nr:MAG: DUF484 family protein [Gammaproteobacteria bacterium]
MTPQLPAGEAGVAAYLEADPDFFLRHPDLTARLRLPHGPAGTLSLVEHQMGLLRTQVEGERRLLAQLIARARDNETLAERLHQLTIQLILATDRPALGAVLREGLCREFDTDAVSLIFPSEAGEPMAGMSLPPDQQPPQAGEPVPAQVAAQVPPQVTVQSLAQFHAHDQAPAQVQAQVRVRCGPLDPVSADALFPNAARPILSAALIPLRAPSQEGLLAIGSADPTRFAADMGTEQLHRLGELVSACLTALVWQGPDQG